MAKQATFSRNIYFISLDADPNMPQSATLVREIEEDATVDAAGVRIVSNNVNTVETDSDVAVSMVFADVSGQVEWNDIASGVQAAILAVMAAHKGTPTTQLEQSVLSNDAETNATVTWEQKLALTTIPLVAGKYRVEMSAQHQLVSAPGTIGLDRSQARLLIDDVSRGVDNFYFEEAHWCSVITSKNVGEGETIAAAVEWRRAGGGVSEISRCRLTVRWIDGETEV